MKTSLNSRKSKYDIIEKKDIELKNIINNINNIKTNSIKEFIFSNKNVPKVWKRKKNYKNMVLDLFTNDNNFLGYFGNTNQNEKNISVNNDLKRPKTSNFEKNGTKIKLKNKENLYNNNISRINENNYSISSSKKLEKTKILKNKLNIQQEFDLIFDDLNEKFPIKNKLTEIYPGFTLETNKANTKKITDINDNLKTFGNSVDKRRFKYLKKLEKNIYNNIFLKNRNKSYINEDISKRQSNDFYYKSKNRIKIIKKELNDPKIFNQLQNMNFYGPYFSYCPFCSDNNIDFYKNIGKKQCISLLNYIKKDRNKRLELVQSKIRKNIKNKDDFF